MSTMQQRDALRELEKVVETWMRGDDAEQISGLLAEAEINDIIRLIERSPVKRGAVLFRLLPPARAGVVFDALDPRHQADMVNALGSDTVGAFFEEMGAEDRVMLLDELPGSVAEQLLKDLSEKDKENTDAVLGYEKGTVGRVMSPEIPEIFPEMTAHEVRELLRQEEEHLETLYTLPVINEERQLLGIVKLRRLFLADGGTAVGDLVEESPSVSAVANAEETARWFLPLGLLALPVVDSGNCLVGIFTFDEAQHVVESEDTEDSARQGGSESLKQPYLSTPLTKLVRSRIVWLLVLAVSAILTVQVLDIFEEKMEQAVVLSLFIPLLTGTGGNTGNQAATTVTRALALGDVKKSDILKVMWREVRVGLMLGAVLGGLGFALASLVYGLDMGMVIGLTLLSICTMSATVGGAMPIVAKTVGADPAVFSNPFISTFCDATGLVIYFLIATSILGL
ncbi:magnesium transporter [Corynebacterium aquatimens]|uniref:magnesium transporter n=1 Tax=Corynebacterium TaxID=1716 RepID=UPI001F2B21B2|nr:magnesium transporter [Corynebacterium sp. CNCTC7651]QYH18939.1 magnesium transporter [Corynebacterium aquatimens]UIZ92230.1 magnesium transporter [Corynebacterium sp. CNCTC7651]UIZ92260.1 magnesium transporter [Corynebacterium sp. CNCTC7651]